jgi:predicted TIM-barrel fold metal-dependent hydrolase
MPTIDADTHVIETEATWEYMDGPDQKFRPVPVQATQPDGTPREYWLIDGKLRPRRGNIGHYTSQGAREMTDIEARIRHMDELGVDIQVLYPSIATQPITTRPEIERALYRSYNRWLADIWTEGKGRLRWAMMPPLMSIEDAIEEMRWSKNHGACAVVMRAVEGDRILSDPYFYPMYEAASELDLAIGIHAGVGNFAMSEVFGQDVASSMPKFKLPVVGAFYSLVAAGIPEHFPKLRIAFVEVSSQWVPYVVRHLVHSAKRELPPDLLKTYRLYVACETGDDLPYVLQYAGEDNLVIGSDYGHNDTSTELEALRNLKKQGQIPAHIVDKILHDNPTALYSL